VPVKFALMGASPRLTMRSGVRSEGQRDSVGKVALIDTTPPTDAQL
jgi:hypothetical protein